MNTFIERLKAELEKPLPGWKVQLKMTSMGDGREGYDGTFVKPASWRTAGVLCLLFPKNGEWHIALMKRTANKHDKHSGQVSFPGGGHEEDDISYEYTALRETEEEFGIPMKDIEILGKLTQLPVPASSYLVFPFVGVCYSMPKFVAETGEVASILEPSVKHLLNPATLKTTDWTSPSGWRLKDVPYFDVDGNVVWGATAMMLSEFLEIARPIFDGDIGRK